MQSTRLDMLHKVFIDRVIADRTWRVLERGSAIASDRVGDRLSITIVLHPDSTIPSPHPQHMNDDIRKRRKEHYGDASYIGHGYYSVNSYVLTMVGALGRATLL